MLRHLVLVSLLLPGLGNLAPLAAAPATRVDPLDDLTVAVTDLTEAGRQRPIPSPSQPVYYVGLNAGYRVYAGAETAGDPPPDQKTMLSVITQVLAEQGFHAADAAHPATQLIACSWGVIGSGGHNLIGPGTGIEFLGAAKLGFMEEPERLLGTTPMDVARRNLRSGKAETISQMAHDRLYAVVLRAYDLESTRTGKAEQLWETRIACSSTSGSLAKALPSIVVSAKRAVGRETAEPVVRNAARTRDAWVEIGESSVVEYIDISAQLTPPAASDPSPPPADQPGSKP